MNSEKFSLKWNDFQQTVTNSFRSLRKEEEQEWSSMESSSREILDEIEMRFGHLVIGKAGQEIN